LANTFPIHTLGPAGDVRNPQLLSTAAAPSSPLAHSSGPGSSASVPHSHMLLPIAKEESTIGMPFGMNTPPRLISGHHAQRHTNRSARVERLRHDVGEIFQAGDLWVVMAAGRPEGNVVWIPARGRDRRRLFSTRIRSV